MGRASWRKTKGLIIWLGHLADSHKFAFGYMTGTALTAMVATLVVTITLDCDGPPPPPSHEKSCVEIIAHPPIVDTNGTVSLTLILSCKGLSHPITYVWAADTGTGLPVGSTTSTQVTWSAPDSPTIVEIRAVAVDVNALVVRGSVRVQVVNPS